MNKEPMPVFTIRTKKLKSKVLCQKIREDVLIRVDSEVSNRAGMSRNTWIQEAIQEKLERALEKRLVKV